MSSNNDSYEDLYHLTPYPDLPDDEQDGPLYTTHTTPYFQSSAAATLMNPPHEAVDNNDEGHDEVVHPDEDQSDHGSPPTDPSLLAPAPPPFLFAPVPPPPMHLAQPGRVRRSNLISQAADYDPLWMFINGVDDAVLDTFWSKKKFDELFTHRIIREGDALTVDIIYPSFSGPQDGRALFTV